MTPSSGASSLVIRRLYKSLLRATKPFTSPSPNAAALTCLLHRTGIDDDIEDWKSYIQRGGLSDSDTSSRSWSSVRTEDEARDLSITYAGSSSGKTLSSSRSTAGNNTDQQQQRQSKSQSYEMLFRRLLREVMGGPDGHRRMLFPSQVEPKRLRDVIRREFRDHGNYGQDSDVGEKESTTDEAMSSLFDDQTRLQVAFVALRELNKKLAHFESLQQAARAPIIENQAARHVSPLNYNDPSSYLRPGTFLVANPNLNDSIFTKSVICILEHKIANTDNKNGSNSNESAFKRNDEIGMTYGLIINKFSINQKTGENRKLCDVFKKNLVPERIGETFVGDAIVRDGGPVHFSFQMLYSVSSSTDADVIEEESSSITTDNIDDDSGPTPTLSSSSSSSSAIGGTLIPMIPDDANTSTALYSDRATYFQGDLLKAIDAVERGKIDRGTLRGVQLELVECVRMSTHRVQEYVLSHKSVSHASNFPIDFNNLFLIR